MIQFLHGLSVSRVNVIAKQKMLISCVVAAQLICVFVFANADCWFSGAKAHICFNSFIPIKHFFIIVPVPGHCLQVSIK